MNPRVKDVAARDAHKLEITFTNGEVGVFDSAHLLSFGVFRELQDVRYFKQACAADGTVVWPHEQDICPDTLYEDSARTDALKEDRRRKAGFARISREEHRGKSA